MQYLVPTQQCKHEDVRNVWKWIHPCCSFEFCQHEGSRLWENDYTTELIGSKTETFEDTRFQYVINVTEEAYQILKYQRDFILLFILTKTIKSIELARQVWEDYCHCHNNTDLRDAFENKFKYFNTKKKKNELRRCIQLRSIYLHNGKRSEPQRIKILKQSIVMKTLKAVKEKMSNAYNLIGGLKQDMQGTR